MKHAGKIAVCLAAGLSLSASLRADDAAAPANPYTLITVRNVFGLNPVPPPDPNAQAAQPPQKITPNGIMTLFGQLQVLFKVSADGSPGSKDGSYILSEGQRQDDIEVVKIDQAAGIVTFKNHGITQALPLANTPATGTASGGSGGGNNFGGDNNNGNGNNPGFGRFGNRGGFGRIRGGQNASGQGGGNNDNGSGNDNLNLRSIPTRNNQIYQPAQQLPQITPEQQVIMIEAQRAQYQQEGNPAAKILPPTPLTPSSDGDDGDSSAPPMP